MNKTKKILIEAAKWLGWAVAILQVVIENMPG